MADIFIVSHRKHSDAKMQPFQNSNNDAIIDESNRDSKVSDASIAISVLECNVLSEGSRCRTNITSGYDSDETSLKDMEIAVHHLETPGKSRFFCI